MITARQCEEGTDAGKWFSVTVGPQGIVRRTGYCALGCAGHGTSEEALAHHLQYQLDREAAFWLERRGTPGACEICGEPTTLRARLGRDTKPFVLCPRHQSTLSLQKLARQRASTRPA